MLGSNTSTFGPRSGLVCASAAGLTAASPTRSIPQSQTKNGFVLKNEFMVPTFRFAELYCAGNRRCSEICLSSFYPKDNRLSVNQGRHFYRFKPALQCEHIHLLFSKTIDWNLIENMLPEVIPVHRDGVSRDTSADPGLRRRAAHGVDVRSDAG